MSLRISPRRVRRPPFLKGAGGVTGAALLLSNLSNLSKSSRILSANVKNERKKGEFARFCVEIAVYLKAEM